MRLTAAARAAVFALAATCVLPAAAQTVECDRLRGEIQAAGQHAGEQWERAAARQQAELDRMQAASDRRGCGHGFFGFGEPAGCDGMSDRLQRLRDKVGDLRDRAQRGDTEQRTALVQRYNALCVGLDGASDADRARLDGQDGLLPNDAADPRSDFFDPDTLRPFLPDGDAPPAPDGAGRVLGQAICVRTCDGGWFPLGATATEDGVGGLEQLCQASCPNTEARLYTMPRDGTLGEATAPDGANYTALPAAFQFQKTFAPACTCKPPNQSWTEALAKAEALLADSADKQDIVVTAAISDQMARPGAVPAPKLKGKAAPKGKASVPAPTPVAGPTSDLAAAATRDGQKALQAPTASEDASGIGGPAKAERLVRQDEGERVTVAGPDGLKRTLRLIVP